MVCLDGKIYATTHSIYRALRKNGVFLIKPQHYQTLAISLDHPKQLEFIILKTISNLLGRFYQETQQ